MPCSVTLASKGQPDDRAHRYINIGYCGLRSKLSVIEKTRVTETDLLRANYFAFFTNKYGILETPN